MRPLTAFLICMCIYSAQAACQPDEAVDLPLVEHRVTIVITSTVVLYAIILLLFVLAMYLNERYAHGREWQVLESYEYGRPIVLFALGAYLAAPFLGLLFDPERVWDTMIHNQYYLPATVGVLNSTTVGGQWCCANDVCGPVCEMSNITYKVSVVVKGAIEVCVASRNKTCKPGGYVGMAECSAKFLGYYDQVDYMANPNDYSSVTDNYRWEGSNYSNLVGCITMGASSLLCILVSMSWIGILCYFTYVRKHPHASITNQWLRWVRTVRKARELVFSPKQKYVEKYIEHKVKTVEYPDCIVSEL